LKIDNLLWHDGNLLDISYSMNTKGKAEITLIVDLYKNYDSPREQKVKITCKKIKTCDLNLDIYELKDNQSAGNIANGYLKNNCLWIYLSDGLVKIVADEFVAQKC